MNPSSERLLKTFRLRLTPTRQEVLHLFLRRAHALSQGDIEKEIKNDLDRVTVYRTLKTFLDKGLIHKVLDGEGGMKYALCSETCSVKGHHHDHVHFKCSRCGQTHCLNVEIPAVKLPKGYKAEEMNLLIAGICERCSA